MTSDENLERMYPDVPFPIRCENGCGTVIAMRDGFRSYYRDDDGSPKLICQCCAAEVGHLDEDDEAPDEAPVCKRPVKRMKQ